VSATLPLPRRANQTIDRAIDRGVAHLRQDWCDPLAYQNYLGLLGLTLLECGVPRNDPAVQRIADLVRTQRDIELTYELSLAIVFLDRLGDPNDDDLIRTFALRLLEGQTGSGPWGYTCVRQQTTPPAGRNSLGLPTGWQQTPFDNSNTQFAVLGLWVAQRHGVSVRKALRLTAQYFRKWQKVDGSWAYQPNTDWYKHSMTCAALFCLAAERSDSPGYVRPSQPMPTSIGTDRTILMGLYFLGTSFDAITKGGAIDAWSTLYFLWSLERVAAIYGLEKIGRQEWYPWTAEHVVRLQQDNGSWSDSGPGPVSTCFALLILRRSNLTPDLLVGVPGMTQPKKPVGDFRQPLVQEPSSNRVPTPGPDRRTKPDADTSAGPPASRVPGGPNRLNRIDEKKD
jgi:hypothetical protein